MLYPACYPRITSNNPAHSRYSSFNLNSLIPTSHPLSVLPKRKPLSYPTHRHSCMATVVVVTMMRTTAQRHAHLQSNDGSDMGPTPSDQISTSWHTSAEDHNGHTRSKRTSKGDERRSRFRLHSRRHTDAEGNGSSVPPTESAQQTYISRFSVAHALMALPLAVTPVPQNLR